MQLLWYSCSKFLTRFLPHLLLRPPEILLPLPLVLLVLHVHQRTQLLLCGGVATAQPRIGHGGRRRRATGGRLLAALLHRHPPHHVADGPHLHGAQGRVVVHVAAVARLREGE